VGLEGAWTLGIATNLEICARRLVVAACTQSAILKCESRRKLTSVVDTKLVVPATF
jgi:hypothetical protein